MAGIDKLISFGYSKYRICLCEILNTYNVSQRVAGPPSGFGGYAGEFLQMLVQNSGVSFDYVVSNKFGRLLEDGTMTGCQGFMQNKQIDIYVCPDHQAVDTAELAEPSSSYFEDDPKFVTKFPDTFSKFDSLFMIFDCASFISVGISILLIALVFYLLTKRKDAYIDHVISRFADLVLQEPVVKIKQTIPLAILTSFWIICAHFITLATMAVILTSLMVSKRMPRVDNREKLFKAIQTGEYKAASFKSIPNTLNTALDQNPDEKLREIGKFIRDNNYELYID